MEQHFANCPPPLIIPSASASPSPILCLTLIGLLLPHWCPFVSDCGIRVEKGKLGFFCCEALACKKKREGIDEEEEI
jgi:hypothetical protein